MLLEKELIAERRRQDARRAGTPPPIPTQPNVPAFVPGGATNKPPIDPGDFYEMSTVDFFLAAMMRNWPSIASVRVALGYGVEFVGWWMGAGMREAGIRLR